jgi:hypothetical protein
VLSRRNLVIWTVLCTVLLLCEIKIGALAFTGDEPRYTYQALGLVAEHRYFPSDALWHAFLHANHLQIGSLGAVAHPLQTLATAVVYGPLLATLGLEAARWLSFVIACAGLLFLLLALRGSWAGVAFIALSAPFLSYMRLLYPESLLFLVVSIALWSLRERRWTLCAMATIALPFLHIRAWPLAFGLMIVVLMEARATRADRSTLVRLGSIWALGTVAFIAFQLGLSGSIAGAAFPTYAPSLWLLPNRLAMQLFGVHQGIVCYMPVVLVAFAGLVAAAVRRERFESYCLFLLALYVATFMWSDAGESYSGRFWIACLPLLAAGFDHYISNARGALAWAPLALLGTLEAVNTVFFIGTPQWYLVNRSTPIPYFIIAQVVPIHLGMLLPVEGNATGIPAYTDPVVPALLWFLAITCAIVLVLSPNRRAHRVAGTAAIILMLLPFAATAFRRVPLTGYTVAGAPDAIRIHFKAPASVRALEFNDKTSLIWSEGAYPREFDVSCKRDGAIVSDRVTPGRPLVTLNGCPEASEIDVRAVPAGEGRTFLNDPGLTAVLAPLW